MPRSCVKTRVASPPPPPSAADAHRPRSIHSSLVQAQEFFKKIKFKYLEQEAKETFLKLILAEDPVQIDREDNNRLGSSRHTPFGCREFSQMADVILNRHRGGEQAI